MEHAKTTLKAINITHGRTVSTEYQIWVDMRRRCHSPERPDYHRYGGRGISVCDRWRDSFEAFLADMGQRPSDRTLERKDNDGPYSPENCCWATKREQTLNTRKAMIVTVNGERMSAKDASLRLGTNASLVWRRIKSGWSVAKAVSTPPKRPK